MFMFYFAIDPLDPRTTYLGFIGFLLNNNIISIAWIHSAKQRKENYTTSVRFDDRVDGLVARFLFFVVLWCGLVNVIAGDEAARNTIRAP